MEKSFKENWFKKNLETLVILVVVILVIGGIYSYYHWYLPWKHLREGWVESETTTGKAICPEGHLIKANVNSGIYHLPGDPYYSRTNANVECFDSPQDAEQQGFRASYGTPTIPNKPLISASGEYLGGYAPDGSFCDYGYNYLTKSCCDDDDYSCEVRDRAPQGATAVCKDGSYSTSQDPTSDCSNHGGIETDSQYTPFVK